MIKLLLNLAYLETNFYKLNFEKLFNWLDAKVF